MKADMRALGPQILQVLCGQDHGQRQGGAAGGSAVSGLWHALLCSESWLADSLLTTSQCPWCRGAAEVGRPWGEPGKA